jgi:predicted PurR-regulated permease PerM
MNLQNAAFIGLLTGVTLAFFGLLADFIQPIFWAATLTVLFAPVQQRIQTLLSQHPSLVAFLTLCFICVTVIIPLWFIASAFASQAASIYSQVESGQINAEQLLEWTRTNTPLVLEALDKIGVTVDEIKDGISTAAITSSQFIASLALTAGQNAVRFAVMFFLMLYILFFFLRDGDALVEVLIQAMPLGDQRERALLTKFAEVSRATIKGTLLIGMIQGLLGGFIFWAVGIEGSVFWGAVMVIMSLLPVVGASLIWGPAALVLTVNGDYVGATVLVAFGVVVIGLIDNFLRPILVGRDLRMPDYLVLLSTLGGLSVFGASGFVIGPLIAALFLTLWVMFALEFNGNDLGAAEPAAGPEVKESVSD